MYGFTRFLAALAMKRARARSFSMRLAARAKGYCIDSFQAEERQSRICPNTRSLKIGLDVHGFLRARGALSVRFEGGPII